jgi:hypothetical protein
VRRTHCDFRMNLTDSDSLLRHIILCAFTKSQKTAISFVMSVCLSVCLPAWFKFPTGRIFMKLIFEDFPNVYRVNGRVIKIWQQQRVIYITTYDNISLNSSQNEKCFRQIL